MRHLITRLSRKACYLPLVFFLLLPFNLLVVACLWLSDLILLPFSFLPRRTPKLPAPKCDSASIVILNWDGKHLLQEFLPSVLEAVRHDGRSHEIIVVDNGSKDGSLEFLKTHFPSVGTVALSRNLRFTGGNNAGFRAAKNDIVILLNNDMQVDPDFIKPLLAGFSAGNDVFSVACQVFFQDKTRRREETGKTRARWKNGFLEPLHDQIVASDMQSGYVPIFWGGGGSCAFDRRKVLAIGGLDTLYDPFYLEDTDLSYQAWKRGWRSLLAVDSLVVHRHRGTNKQKFGDNYVDNTIRKNQYLFIWKNITEPSWILRHGCMLPVIQLRLVMSTRPSFELKAFFRALAQLPEALLKRHWKKREYRFSDPKIFQETAESFPHSGTSSIDFSQGDFAAQLGQGWFHHEENGQMGYRWTEQQGSFCLFATGSEQFLEVRGEVPTFVDVLGRAQKITVFLSGQRIFSHRWGNSGPFCIRIPLTLTSQPLQRFTFVLSRSFCPAQHGFGSDERHLGIMVHELRLV